MGGGGGGPSGAAGSAQGDQHISQMSHSSKAATAPPGQTYSQQPKPQDPKLAKMIQRPSLPLMNSREILLESEKMNSGTEKEVPGSSNPEPTAAPPQEDDSESLHKPTKADFFAARLASAVGENEISDSEETFIYESAANSTKNAVAGGTTEALPATGLGSQQQAPLTQVPPSPHILASGAQLPQQQQQQKDGGLVSANPPKRVRAVYDLASNDPDELTFKKGDIILVLEQVYRDWWRGSLRGSIGIFPLNYVTPLAEPTEQELRLEAAKEQELFAQQHNVDQLYYKMTDSSARGEDPTQNPQVNELYGSVTPLRPEVAKTISKYARKREDLLSLRQVLANAEATYNQLLDRATNAYAAPLPMQPPPRSNQRPQPNYPIPYPP